MPEARNIISGTKVGFTDVGQGISITGAAAVRNVVQGNFIGTDASGANPSETAAMASWSAREGSAAAPLRPRLEAISSLVTQEWHRNPGRRQQSGRG